MSKKTIHLISFVLLLGLVLTNAANAADPNLVGWWKFDETSGTIAYDSSGKGNNGTLYNFPTDGSQWVAGYRGNALQFAGGPATPPSDYVNFLTSVYGGTGLGHVIKTLSDCTFSIWVNWSGRPDPNVGGWQRIIDFGTATTNYIYLCPSTGAANAAMRLALTAGGASWDEIDASIGALPTGWHHIAFTVSESSKTMILYLDGDVVGSKTSCTQDVNDLGVTTANYLGRSQYSDPYFGGLMDDFQIYNRVLSRPEIKKVANPEKASMPTPADGSVVSSTDVSLQWQPGIYAAQHDIYFASDWNDVNNAKSSDPCGPDKVYKGRQSVDANSYNVSGLTPGITYYWRIDEVNLPNIWRGDIWRFTVQPLTAYNPSPPDGAVYVDPNTNLAWSPGAKAKFHDVYLDTSFSDVNTATKGNPFAVQYYSLNQGPNTYDPPAILALGTTYYWRIDEVNDPCIWKGQVWEFKTGSIQVTDPNLRGWWKFDDGMGTLALDWSGYYHHGTLINGPNWVSGQIDGALQLDGTNDYVDLPIGSVIASLSKATIATWVNWSGTGGDWQRIFNFGTATNNYTYLSPNSDTGPMWVAIITPAGATDLAASSGTLATGWHHVAVVIELGNLQLYLDGEAAGNISTDYVLSDLGVTTDNWLGRPQWPNDPYFNGSLDDFRIYNKVLSQAEIKLVMRGNPFLAWDPKPATGSTPDIRHAKPLSWSPGEGAAKHDVYFGTDANAVADANTSTVDIYRGRQEPDTNTTYTPPEELQKGKTYYWRIDEVNLPNIWKGPIWNFTVAEYLVVDDFESYNPNLADVWKPGGNAMVELSTAPVHEGSKAMAIDYNNTPSPYYSEAYADTNGPNSLGFGIDWTVDGVKALSLWFQGYPDVRGSVIWTQVNPPMGPYSATISADGNDIWGNSDQFYYAHREINDVGSITARVDSMDNTHASAKAGLMFRKTLDPNSRYAIVAVTPGSGVIFEYRAEDNGSSVQQVAVAGVTAPHWIKLQRRYVEEEGFWISAYHANDVEYSQGIWTRIGGTDANDVQTFLPGWPYELYIGLCVTSHNYGVMCDANFSNVTFGDLDPQYSVLTPNWESQDIGIPYNDPEPMYVTLQDNDSNATLYYPGTYNPNYADANVTQIGTWTEWNIDLNDFRVKGVDLDKVQRMYVGVGDGAPGSGSGTVYVDDIRLYPPRFVADKLPRIPADLVRNGVINEEDLGMVTDNWLIRDYNVTPQNPGDANLVARYEFEGDFNDSKDGYHGEPNNGATTVTDPDPNRGKVAVFDGVDDYVALPIGSLINSLTSSTFMTWVNFSNTGGEWQRIFDFGSNTTVYMFLSPRILTDGVMRFAITIAGNGAEDQVDAPSTLASGWRHVAVTIDADNDTIRLYLDGMQVGENIAATLDPSSLGNTTNNWLGRSQFAADGYFNGRLDDFRIYNRALSQGEVAYLAGKPAGIQFRQPLELLLTPADPNINLYNVDGKIDFRDFAEFGKFWYQQQVWPTW